MSVYKFVEKILSKYQCSFRKGFNSQHYLVYMTEKRGEASDNGCCYWVLLTDLFWSEVFVFFMTCQSHSFMNVT